MDIVIDLAGRSGRVEAVYRALRAAIEDGRLGAGFRLPATRVLAADLKVGRNSVSVAYERLVAEGYLLAKAGAGTFVAGVRRQERELTAPADPLVARGAWTVRESPRSPATTFAPASPTPPSSRSTPGGA